MTERDQRDHDHERGETHTPEPIRHWLEDFPPLQSPFVRVLAVALVLAVVLGGGMLAIFDSHSFTVGAYVRDVAIVTVALLLSIGGVRIGPMR